MFSVAYVNGRYEPYFGAVTHIEDRGYQLSDGVYEVVLLKNGKMIDADGHLKRLQRSLKETQIAAPCSMAALRVIVDEVVERSGRSDGLIYIQITRGIAPRDHGFPKGVRSSLVVYILKVKLPKPEVYEAGVKIITQPEIRWARPDIKSISLLPNVLAKQKATETKAREAIFVNEKGFVTEGSSMNVFIVDKNGAVITHPADSHILGGITREVTLELARKAQVKVIERPFTLKELYAAEEVFITSTSAGVMPVVEADGKKISSGKPGRISKRLGELYNANVEKQLC